MMQTYKTFYAICKFFFFVGSVLLQLTVWIRANAIAAATMVEIVFFMVFCFNWLLMLLFFIEQVVHVAEDYN